MDAETNGLRELSAGERKQVGQAINAARAHLNTALADRRADLDAADRIQALEAAGSLGPVVGTHTGPGTVGFFWFLDE